MASVGSVLDAVGALPGEKQVVVFSRCDLDDLSNPVWAQTVPRMSAGGTLNRKLQTEMMIRDVTLARVALKKTTARQGLTVHSVGGNGESYTGGFGEVALDSGGSNFRMENELPNRLAQNLNLWATRYDLTIAMPLDTARPSRIQVDTNRKGLKLFAPTLQ